MNFEKCENFNNCVEREKTFFSNPSVKFFISDLNCQNCQCFKAYCNGYVDGKKAGKKELLNIMKPSFLTDNIIINIKEADNE